MGRRLLIAAVACCGLLLLAGCGGSKKKVGAVYHRAGTIDCLQRHHYEVTTDEKDVNFIAWSAPGGGLRAWKAGTRKKGDLILAFGNSLEDARQTMRAVRRFALRPPLFRYRFVRANVVVMYAYRPTEAEKKQLISCLNSSV
jgi:hypothetical protein